MPAGSSPLLLDTSAAVALLVQTHAHHEEVYDALRDQPRGLAGHAAFEAYSVLTRLPPPDRLSPAEAAQALAWGFPHSRYLSSEAAAQLVTDLAAKGIAGGAVYDALVGATAVEHGLTLVSRDRRAASTYQDLGADVRLL